MFGGPLGHLPKRMDLGGPRVSVARGHSVWNAGGGGDDQKSLIGNYKPSGVSIWALEYHTLILFS